MVAWAVVFVRDGEISNDLDITNGASFYDPEQNVLAFGTVMLEPNSSTSAPTVMHVEGTSKAMRKMMDGNKLELVTLSNALNGAQMYGALQFFVMY